MGIIRKQSIKTTLFSYFGVVIGFITTAWLFPKYLDKEQIGVLRLVISYSLLFAQISSLGFTNVTMRLFPYFRNSEKGHQGFLGLSLIVTLMGFVLSSFLFFALVPFIKQQEDSVLFMEFFWYILPLTFFTAAFNILEAYNRSVFDSVTGIILREFIQRILILVSILVFLVFKTSFAVFAFMYVSSMSLPTILIFLKVWSNKQLFLKPNFNFIQPEFKKEIISVSLFGILQGFGLIAISNIDTIMVSWYVDLKLVGVYATCVVFGILINIPSRALMKISSTILANAWKDNDLETINVVYYKSCIHQFLFGVFVFIGIWANIDLIFKILPSGFEKGKWVVFFIMLANLSEILTGLNGTIINTSKFYKASAMFIALLILVLVGFNLYLIPILGITGAAVATFIANASNSGFKYLFLYRKYKMQPLNFKIVLIGLIGLFAYFSVFLLPSFSNFWVDLFSRSFIISVIYGNAVYFFKISPEINNSVKSYVFRFIHWPKNRSTE